MDQPADPRQTVSFLGTCPTGRHTFPSITQEATTGGKVAGPGCCGVSGTWSHLFSSPSLHQRMSRVTPTVAHGEGSSPGFVGEDTEAFSHSAHGYCVRAPGPDPGVATVRSSAAKMPSGGAQGEGAGPSGTKAQAGGECRPEGLDFLLQRDLNCALRTCS